MFNLNFCISGLVSTEEFIQKSLFGFTEDTFVYTHKIFSLVYWLTWNSFLLVSSEFCILVNVWSIYSCIV